MNATAQAIREGIRQGLQIAADPSPETYLRIRQEQERQAPKKQDTVALAWQKTGQYIREAMNAEKSSRNK